MESRTRAIDRLLCALERLVDEESVRVAVGDHAGLLRTQQRTTPVVVRLAELGGQISDPAAHRRVAALLEKRQRSQQLLAVQMGKVREELIRARASQSRLAAIAPVYLGRARRRLERRLCAVS